MFQRISSRVLWSQRVLFALIQDAARLGCNSTPLYSISCSEGTWIRTYTRSSRVYLNVHDSWWITCLCVVWDMLGVSNRIEPDSYRPGTWSLREVNARPVDPLIIGPSRVLFFSAWQHSVVLISGGFESFGLWECVYPRGSSILWYRDAVYRFFLFSPVLSI